MYVISAVGIAMNSFVLFSVLLVVILCLLGILLRDFVTRLLRDKRV